MKRLKKLITFPNILMLFWIGVCTFLFIKIDVASAIILTIFSGFFCKETISENYKNKKENDSFNDPYVISENDAGKMFRVADISDNKIGLIEWGYQSDKCGDLQSYKDYYLIDGIPNRLRNINMIIKVILTDNGLTFHLVQVDDFISENKPYKILEKAYKA